VSLNVTVARSGTFIYKTTVNEAVEIGRRQVGEPKEPLLYQNPSGQWRLIIADLELRTVPRSLILLDPMDEKNWRITNLHKQATIAIPGSKLLNPGESATLELPVTIPISDGFSILLQLTTSAPFTESTICLPGLAKAWTESIGALGVPRIQSSSEESPTTQFTLTRLSNQADATIASKSEMETVLGWLEQVAEAMQRPVSSPDFFLGIARAAATIIEVDRAEVILWDGNQWEFDPSRQFVSSRVDRKSLRAPSNSMMQRVLATKQIVLYPSPDDSKPGFSTDSVRQLHTAVACPILDIGEAGNEIYGVLYADRELSIERYSGIVTEAEQKFIAILATAISSSIARKKRETLVTKYQQFFSSKVTDAISRNPALLEGEDVEVTVLFCDIRGFSRTTDQIGSKAAMKWIGDTLSEISAVVLESDGVLVDYVGDEMFAMWGAPESTADHAFRSAIAARQMMTLRKALSERFRDSIPEGVDFGIGMCTGPARVGNTGSKQKFKYGPMGRTVNLGSRIQSLTKHWKVTTLMDEETAACLPPDLLKRRLCKAQVVGLDGELNLFELMPEDSASNSELVVAYGNALDLYESGLDFRKAVRAFGELVQRFPMDGPSLMMLVRAVNELVEPSADFSPVWCAKSK
jgi:adenylate cyclase